MKDGQQGKNTTFAILLTAGAICVCVISVCFGFALGKNGFGLAVETAGTQEAAAGTGETEESTREAEPQRMLWVSGVNAPESFSSFDPEELGGNLADTLYYKEVEDVKIRIGTEWMDFPEAIREGKVTSAELFLPGQNRRPERLLPGKGKFQPWTVHLCVYLSRRAGSFLFL